MTAAPDRHPHRGDELWDNPDVHAWNSRILPYLVAAAIVPLVADRAVGGVSVWVVAAVDFVSWLIFAFDLVVRMRLMPGFLRTRWGLFTLAIVVVTFPAYLLIGGYARLVPIVRLALVVRLVVLAAHVPALRRLVNRLGSLFAFTAVVLVVGSWIAYKADGPASNFDSFGDSLWWGIVTMTTTGYGDIVPDTVEGRITGAVLMVSGLTLLGILAASMASYFTSGDQASGASAPPDNPGELPSAEPEAALPAPDGDLAALRRDIAELRQLVERHLNADDRPD